MGCVPADFAAVKRQGLGESEHGQNELAVLLARKLQCEGYFFCADFGCGFTIAAACNGVTTAPCCSIGPMKISVSFSSSQNNWVPLA